MSSMQCRKLVLDENLIKTGGSHMVFLLYETFWEGKNVVSTPRHFLKHINMMFLMPFILVFTAKNHYNFIKKWKFENFILYHAYLVYFDDKKPLKHFYEILLSKHLVVKSWSNLGKFLCKIMFLILWTLFNRHFKQIQKYYKINKNHFGHLHTCISEKI